MKNFKLIICLVGAGLFFLNASGQDALKTEADTDFEKWYERRLDIQFGGYFANTNSNIVLGTSTLGAGLHINLEDALGLESSSNVVRADAVWRFGKTRKSFIRASWFAINRTAVRTNQIGPDYSGA